MTENYGVLFVLNRASQYLTRTTTMTDKDKEVFKTQLYGYLSGQEVTKVNSNVVSFLIANGFLDETELVKLSKEDSKNNQSKTAPVTTEEDSEPEA